MELFVRHVFPCSTERFWEIFWSEAHDREVDRAAGVTRETLREWREGEEVVGWHVLYKPAPRHAQAAAQLFGGVFSRYEQVSRLEQGRGHLEWEVRPELPGVSAAVDMRGKMRVRGLEEERTERVVEGTISVGIPLLGRRIESTIHDTVVESYERTARVTERFIREGLR